VSETQAEKEERVYQHVTEAKKRIEQDIAETSEQALKRIEADAATLVTLALVSELLPEHIQSEVQDIITLHENIWNLDTPPHDNTTPRKPLGRRLIERLTFFRHSHTEKFGRRYDAHEFLQPLR
jgi:hypothetical protein